jgi:G3E family GTPase
MNKIPVYILTGYLGSGKTTFLNQWLKERSKERFFVIENEIGQVNIDSQLVKGKEVDLIGLTAGCICCSLQDELLDVLEEVSARRTSFDHLVIETTGIADPSTIVSTFYKPDVEQVFELRTVITVVDALNIDYWLGSVSESAMQVAYADVLFVSKADGVEESKQLELIQKLAQVNPTAPIIIGFREETVDTIMQSRQHTERQLSQFLYDMPEWISQSPHGIKTFSLVFDGFIDLRGLVKDLVGFLNKNLNEVYRIKAIIAVRDYNKSIVLQTVRNGYSFSDGQEWTLDDEPCSTFVFIGKNLDQSGIRTIIEPYVQDL